MHFVQKFLVLFLFFPLSLLFPYWNTATSLQMLSRSQTQQILQFKPEKEYFEGTGRVLNNVGREIAVDSKSKMSLRAIFTLCVYTYACECFWFWGV